MFVQALKAELTAIRLLFRNKFTLLLLVMIYGALLGAGYLFVSTREATIPQLILTFGLVVLAPALFFALQAVSVNYVSGASARSLV
jgi:formate/nitrite transporter FocA (FNT family)